MDFSLSVEHVHLGLVVNEVSRGNDESGTEGTIESIQSMCMCVKRHVGHEIPHRHLDTKVL